MNTDALNPKIPSRLQENLNQEKQQAFTLYLDFVVDATASMYSIFPAVYYSALHFIEALSKYDVGLELGLTLMRCDRVGEEAQTVYFEDGRETFTKDVGLFLSRLKNTEVYGGSPDGKESVHAGIRHSLEKFPFQGRNRAIMVYTDAYGSDDEEDFQDQPIGQAIFFTTLEMMEEDFHFALIGPDGSLDEEASPAFMDIHEILHPLSPEFIDDVVKPLKDLLRGVSIGV